MNPRTVRELLRTAFTKQMFRQVKLAAISHAKAEAYSCPSCNFVGKFGPFGMPVRTAALCPKCWSLERQRFLVLAIQRGDLNFTDRDVVHFAPEVALGDLIRSQRPRSYRLSDFANGLELQLDLENLDLPDGSLDIVMANHVLEHVDDRKALAEIFRVLRPGGEFMCMVPIVEGWASTYEDPTITSPRERERHFGQFDHVRYYGRDIRDRFREAGFDLREITTAPDDALRFRLSLGETIFVGQKSGRSGSLAG